LPITSKAEPELRNVGASLFEREGELAKVNGQLPRCYRIVQRFLPAFVGTLQEKGRSIF
jgi:hypothetical protein